MDKYSDVMEGVMFNLKEIKKIFLATLLLTATVVFACPSYAQEIDCSGKTGYELNLCEERKALAEKGQKSQDKIKEAQEKQKEVKKANEEGSNKADKKADKKAKEAESAAISLKGAEASKGSIEDNKAKIKEAQALKADAQKRMTEALKTGDSKAAAEAQKEMVAYNQEIGERSVNVKNLEEAKKEADKAEKKANKAEEKAEKKADKAEKKAQEKVVNAAEKSEKNANKASEKADKEVKKLQDKCDKNPEKCDTAALQAALAKQDAAKEAAAAAKSQREDLDGTTKAKEDAAKAKAEAEAAAAKNLENAGDTEAAAIQADADGQAEAAAKPKRCAEATGVFEIIACKAMTTLADLRKIVYIFAGFGLIAFAWGAIFNKISWKHFSQIAIALFLLSMMGTFIGYFGYDSTYKALKFGEYLADDHEHTLLTDENGNPTECDEELDPNNTFCNQQLDEVVVTAPKKKWSLKDLKGTVQAGIGAIQKANSAYQTAKSTVENVVNQAQTIGNAIKNGEGGLSGVLNTMNTVATASGSIMNSGQLLANNLAHNIGGITEDVKNAGMTQKEREQRAKDKARLDTLTKMCNDGACNGDGPNAKKLRAEMEALKNKESTQDTKVNQWLNNDEKGGGATIMAGIDKVGNIGNAATNAVRNASNAAQNGATIGGGINGGAGQALGAIFGAATAAGDVMDMKGNPNFDFKSDGTKRKEQAAADKAAFEKSSGHVTSSKKEGSKTTETRGDGSTKIVDSATGTTTVKNKDGSVTTTTKNGSKVEVKADGTRIVTNSNGKVTTTTPDGKTSTDESNIKTKYSGDASIKDQAKNKTPDTKKDEAKKEEVKKEEPKKEGEAKPSTDKADGKNDIAKIKEALSKQCDAEKDANAKSICKSCASSITSSDPSKAAQEAQACIAKKVKEFNTAQSKAHESTMKKWCKENANKIKGDCFMGDYDKKTCLACGLTYPSDK